MTVAVALLLATTASAQVLVITSGGRRAFDREPDTADTNCLGWTYGASPAIGDRGELVGMYVASDALTQHCRVSIDSAVRFGDRLKDRKLARCESIVDMACEHAVRPLAGAMQQVQDGLERGRRRPGSLGHDMP